MNCVPNIKYLLALLLIVLLVSAGSGYSSAQSSAVPQNSFDAVKMPGADDYWSSFLCQDCHDKIYYQHSQSMHARSFENPVFQAEYFNELLPKLGDPGLIKEAKACIACHSPITYIKTGNGYMTSKDQVYRGMSGVTCDFCHTIRGYKGGVPGNANYISTPGYQKFGPFEYKTDWHHAYSELQTKSEFCAICHNRVNHKGLEIISTFTEWKKSSYARRGIQCQDCHMNVQGFLTGGQPVYESGKAARIKPGYAPYREKLYTHRFPGAHSRSQVAGAITLKIEINDADISPGDDITIDVIVDNSRTGHKMPSGSAELRVLVLQLRSVIGDKVITVPASSYMKTDMHDVAGEGKFDKFVLGKDVPHKSRLYRAVCVDEKGKQTLFSYEASSIIFDNRLNASEVRKESYNFKVPGNAEGPMQFGASLWYLPYPGSFAEKIGVPGAAMIEIASAEKIVRVKSR